MAGHATRTGRCLCGAVRYRVVGEPLRVGICHCADCRRATGSAFLFYGDWPPEAFSVEGRYETYDGRSFCPACGARLFHLSIDHAEINLGSLDSAPTGLMPRNEGWTVRREGWLDPLSGAQQHRRDPPAQPPD